MTAVRLSRLAPSPDPRFGWVLFASLAGHLLLLAALSAGWPAPPRSGGPPPIFVDLVHRPVLNPQAGRPEPRTVAPNPVPAVPPASLSKAAPPAKAPPPAADNHVKDALERLREEQSLQEKFAALRRTQAVPMDAPVGMPDAKGNEAGIYSEAYVREYIRQNWALSPYLLADPAKMAGIEAWVRLSYTKSGRLESFRIEKASSDVRFDESIKRALVKSKQLPVTLPVTLEDRLVIFNLKQFAGAQR